jgi:hypothetical protein
MRGEVLKALMEDLTIAIPKTHDLVALQALLVAHHPPVRSLGLGLAFLSRFAVTIRYPGMKATKRQSEAALRWTERMRAEARSLLGVKSRGKKR